MWLSVPFGIIITLICFSGAMLVFENEVNELMWPELYFVKQVEAAPLPVDQLLEKVAATLPDDVSVSGVSISSDPERTYQVSLSKPPFFGVCRSVYGRDYRKESAQRFFCVYVSDAPLVAG